MTFKWNETYDTLDEIPEGARDAYEEKDGKFSMVRALSKKPLENAYKAEKAKREAAEAKAKNIPDDFDAEKFNAMVEEFEELKALKEAGQLDGKNNEKIEELVAKRVETEKKKFERERAKLETSLKETADKLGLTSGKLKTATLETQARALAAKFKIADHSIDDALARVGQSFDLDDDGNIIDRSDAGRTMEDWFAEVVPQKPGWTFDPKAGGTGATSGGGGKAGAKTMKRADFEKLMTTDPKKAATFMGTVRSGEAQLVD